MVLVAGLVTCRQRPETAKGILFIMLEDETAMLNVVVPRELHEVHARSTAPSRCWWSAACWRTRRAA